jgi:hypothetical protein
MGLGFLINIGPAIELRSRLEELAKTIHFGLAPHAGILIGGLAFFGTLLVAIGVILIVLLTKSRASNRELPRG